MLNVCAYRSLRKTAHILSALSTLVPSDLDNPITYYALDLQEPELRRTLTDLDQSDVGAQIRGRVAARGLCGTYDDCLKFIEEGGLDTRASLERPATEISDVSSNEGATGIDCDGTLAHTPSIRSTLHILFLGSTLGNFNRGEEAAFLRSLPLRAGSGDTLLLGMDHENEPEEIEKAYNDPKGFARAFFLNGLQTTGRTLGDESLFDENKWEYVGRYNKENRECLVRASYRVTYV